MLPPEVATAQGCHRSLKSMTAPCSSLVTMVGRQVGPVAVRAKAAKEHRTSTDDIASCESLLLSDRRALSRNGALQYCSSVRECAGAAH